MDTYNTGKHDELPLLETTLRTVKQKLELVAGCALGAVIGAIDGGKQGLSSIQEHQAEQAADMLAIEKYANGEPQHRD